MDLFKAIFADSSSDNESSGDEGRDIEVSDVQEQEVENNIKEIQHPNKRKWQDLSAITTTPLPPARSDQEKSWRGDTFDSREKLSSDHRQPFADSRHNVLGSIHSSNNIHHGNRHGEIQQDNDGISRGHTACSYKDEKGQPHGGHAYQDSHHGKADGRRNSTSLRVGEKERKREGRDDRIELYSGSDARKEEEREKHRREDGMHVSSTQRVEETSRENEVRLETEQVRIAFGPMLPPGAISVVGVAQWVWCTCIGMIWFSRS